MSDFSINVFILMALILSMVLAPVLIKFNVQLASIIFRRETIQTREEDFRQIEKVTRDISDYVVICGFGNVGQTIAASLYQQDIQFIGLDTDPEVIKSAWREGDPVYFGDVTHVRILEAAGLKRAKALVICLDNPNSTLKTLLAARSITQDIPVLVRARDDSLLEKLIDAGADDVITEKLETGIMMTTQLLLLLKKSPEEVYEHIKIFRDDRYPLLKK